MMMLRRRMTVAALSLLTAGLAACANDPTSPLADFNADGDTLKRVPTLPWVTTGTVPTLPWVDVGTTVPTLPWVTTGTTVPTLPWVTTGTTVPTLPWVSARRTAAPAGSY